MIEHAGGPFVACYFVWTEVRARLNDMISADDTDDCNGVLHAMKSRPRQEGGGCVSLGCCW